MNKASISVRDLREKYEVVRAALPWLDVSCHPDVTSTFGTESALRFTVDAVRAISMRDWMNRPALRAVADIVRAAPGQFQEPFDVELDSGLEQLARQGVPVVVQHTDIAFDTLVGLAARCPGVNWIIESGPRKIIYTAHLIRRAMATVPNLYLSTYNLCNWLALETFHRDGFAGRLLFGTHQPCFSPDAAMAPLIFSRLPWEVRCDIAGNNLRRLLGRAPVIATEPVLQHVEPFIIDAHAHSVRPGDRDALNFPLPDSDMDADQWLDFMNLVAVEQMFLMPLRAVLQPAGQSNAEARHLIDAAPQRFFYIEPFSPLCSESEASAIESTIQNPSCVGLKIHPSAHGVAGDDPRYRLVYEMARRHGKPILTHSWEISDYNPTQYLSHPDRFAAWAREFPDVKLVLGHAGGRPSAFDATVKLCQERANVYVDVSGDYYHAGLIDALANSIGVDRILFGSDADWVDPRCNLGPVLASGCDDAALFKILRTNALLVFRRVWT